MFSLIRVRIGRDVRICAHAQSLRIICTEYVQTMCSVCYISFSMLMLHKQFPSSENIMLQRRLVYFENMQKSSVAADLHSQIVWHDEQRDIQIIVVLCYQNLLFRYLFPECFLVAFCIDNIEFLVVRYSSILNCFRRDSLYTWAVLTSAVMHVLVVCNF